MSAKQATTLEIDDNLFDEYLQEIHKDELERKGDEKADYPADNKNADNKTADTVYDPNNKHKGRLNWT